MADKQSPWQLVVAAALVILEGAAALAVAVWLIVELATQPAQSLPLALGLIVVVTLVGLWVVATGRALRNGRAWARSAAVFVQLLLAALAAGSLSGDQSGVWLFIALLAPALFAGVLLFLPSVVDATRDRTSDR